LQITFESYVTTPRCQQNKTRHSLLIRNTAPGFSPNTLPIFRKNKISIKNNLILKPVHVCWMSVTTQLGFMVRSKRYIDRIHQSRSGRTGSYSVSSALFVKPLNSDVGNRIDGASPCKALITICKCNVLSKGKLCSNNSKSVLYLPNIYVSVAREVARVAEVSYLLFLY
jgi:hypothetical protein